MKKTYIKPEMETEVMELESMIAASEKQEDLIFGTEADDSYDVESKRRGIWDTW